MKVSKNSFKEVKGYNPQSLTVNEVFKRKAIEAKSRIKEEYFDAFFHRTPVGLAIINDSLRYERVNETLARYNGLKVEEHIGKSIYEIIPALAPKLEGIIQKILTTDEPIINAEISGETKGFPGQIHYWLASYMPLHDVNGSSSAIGAVIFDITEHKRLEAQWENDAFKYQSLEESAENTILILNNKKGNFLYASPQTEISTGYKSEEILELNVKDLFPVTGKSSFTFDNNGVWQEYSLRQRNGVLIDVEIFSIKISAEQTQIVIRHKPLSKKAMASVVAFPKTPQAVETQDEVHTEANGKLQLLKDVAAAINTAAEILEERVQGNFGLRLEGKIDFYERVSQFETQLIQQAMARTQGNQKRAAELLGIRNTTLNQMLKRYNMLPVSAKKA